MPEGTRSDARRERLLGLFAPAATVVLLGAWLVGTVVGYGLILFALRGELRPAPADLGTAIYGRQERLVGGRALVVVEGPVLGP